MRIGRIPYINCYPVYGAVDRGIVPLPGTLVNGTPSQLNAAMAAGDLDVSVVSAVEYARASSRYVLLPDLAISCNGPVRSVLLFSKRPAEDLTGHRVLLSRSSMTSVALLKLLFANVWHSTPTFADGDAELCDVATMAEEPHEARLVIGDAALLLRFGLSALPSAERRAPMTELYDHVYDLGTTWTSWTGLPFVFAVWVAQRTTSNHVARLVHERLLESRDWGLAHLGELAHQAARATGVELSACEEYLSGLDYGLSGAHLEGITEFFRRLAEAGEVPGGPLAFLPAA